MTKRGSRGVRALAGGVAIAALALAGLPAAGQAASAKSLKIKGFGETTAGETESFSLIAKDRRGKRATTYRGRVTFNTDDGQAIVPPDYKFKASDEGKHRFNIEMREVGTFVVGVEDVEKPALEDSFTTEVGPGPVDEIVVSAPGDGAMRQVPSASTADFAPLPAAPPETLDFDAVAFDEFGNSIGEVTDDATWTISPDGNCQAYTCGAVTSAGDHTVTATLGGVQGQATVSVPTLFTTHSMTCRGENYDVNGFLTDACEAQPLTGMTTQATALFLGTYDDCDEDPPNQSGILHSDSRVHTNPTVPGFVSENGSAPAWMRVYAQDDSCVLEYDVQITTSGGGVEQCYRFTIFWQDPDGPDNGSETIFLYGAGTTSVDGDWDFPGTDDSAHVYFKLDKFCTTTVQESVTWTIEYAF